MNELVKASPASLPMVAETCERAPEENTERLLSLLRNSGCSVVIKHKLTFPSDPKTGEPSAWRDVVNGAEVALADGANVEKAMRSAEAALAPAAAPNIGIWLTEVAHITARRAEDAESATLTMAAYIKRLVQYPGDIVRQTLQEWSGKWFPTWGELKEILDARTAPRIAIRDAIGRLNTKAIAGPTVPMPAAFAEMDPESQVQWLRKEAGWARRRDPERAQELEDRADEIERGERSKVTAEEF